ncbi:MAG: hypothetical protein EZS28_029939 [Streblomastix strix]|uniref:Uncharacterized protein n=1 Tax=Streblomastix strix TaxID=222440 RepID=A0A5J4UXR8_9EUKA|nr:MAG: hypothetical protein EZS28_029939 [Streblomastix strix]
MGLDFFSILAEELKLCPIQLKLPFFRLDEKLHQIARCVLVDMEEKVIQQTVSQTQASEWIYDKNNIIVNNCVS